MTPNEIEARFSDLMTRLTAGGDGNRDQLLADARAFTAAVLAEDSPLPEEERQIIAQAVQGIVELIEDPESSALQALAAAAAQPPQPDIFDAIDAADLDGVKAALATEDVNARHGAFDATALYQAMSSLDPDIAIMHALLDAGADPSLGLTHSNVLHGLGFGNGNGLPVDALAGVIQRCVELGADLEQRSDQLQWTPLITAASEWNEVAVEALLVCGADISAQAGPVGGVFGAGHSAAHFAAGHPATLAVLARYANPN